MTNVTDDQNLTSALIELGIAMEDAEDIDSTIPSAFTYFGQFLSHELLCFELHDRTVLLNNRTVDLRNERPPFLTLESLFGRSAPRDSANPSKMQIGRVSPIGKRVPGKSDYNDLPRASDDEATLGGRALIGDPRNDRNLCLAQLHVALLRAHNNLVEIYGDYHSAREALRQMIQEIVVGDYLPRVVQKDVLSDVFNKGPSIYRFASFDRLEIPREFVSAFRFGHTMVRTRYNFNCWFEKSGLELSFAFTSESGNLLNMRRLMRNWVIDWARFVEVAGPPMNFARKIGPVIAEPLKNLRGPNGYPFASEPMQRMAVVDLLWNRLLRVPCGQSLSSIFGLEALTPREIMDTVPDKQKAIVERYGFHKSTPLFYYVLVEAATASGGYGSHLGVLGSRIIAETFWNVLHFSPLNACVAQKVPDIRTLADLLRFSECESLVSK